MCSSCLSYILSEPKCLLPPPQQKQLRDRGVVQLQCASGTGFLTITKKGMVEESKPPKPNAPIDKNSKCAWVSLIHIAMVQLSLKYFASTLSVSGRKPWTIVRGFDRK